MTGEKKFAILRLVSDGVDKVIIQPVLLSKSSSLAAAKRKVMKQFPNGTNQWIGWVDQYTLFDPISMEEKP
jgi:hypothetical protein